MAQHDYDLADATGAAFRADGNLLFIAIASMNSGATEPATKFANMGWFDTANNLMKVRNEANAAWITVAEKTATDWKVYHGTVALEAAVLAWTANHDFGAQLLLSGVISPSQITVNQNNYNPSGLSGVVQLRLNSDASRNITGLSGGATGRLLLVANIGSFDIILSNQNASSSAGNRFLFAGGSRTLTPDESVLLRYDGTSSRWRAAQDIIDIFGGALLHVRDEKSSGVDGGTFTKDVWQTRVLNTVVKNEITGASLGSNQITLPAGTYFIRTDSPVNIVVRHQTRLWNASDSSLVIQGTTGKTSSATIGMMNSKVVGRFTLTGTKALELQHKCSATKSGDGFGAAASLGTEVYSEATIWRVG